MLPWQESHEDGQTDWVEVSSNKDSLLSNQHKWNEVRSASSADILLVLP